MAHIKKLPPGSQLAREEKGDQADWGYLAENVAQLVDVMTAWLNYEYANWTADPDEVEAERRKRKREGRKPPKFPMVAPVAARPPSRRQALIEEYLNRADLPSVEHVANSDELDVLLGL